VRLVEGVRRSIRWYGASPPHLLGMLGCFGLAGYAATRLLVGRPVAVAVWFVGAAVAHDVVFFPLYAIVDRSVTAVLRRRGRALPPGPWVNYVRVPAMLSGLLLLVWFPLILRLPSAYAPSTGFSTRPYLGRWLLVSGGLFAASALALAVQLRRAGFGRRHAGMPPRAADPSGTASEYPSER